MARHETLTVNELTITGNVGVDSSVTSNGIYPVIVSGALQALTDAGAVSVANYFTTLTTTGAAAVTLADGVVKGQLKKIQLIAAVGNATLTPTNLNGGTTITFSVAGDVAELIWDGSGWQVLALRNEAAGTGATPVLA